MTLARLARPATQRVSTPSRSAARPLVWPDLPPGLKLTEALAPLQADHVRLSAEFRTARVALEAAEKGRMAAANSDRQSFAAALRAGSKDPGNPATVALEKEIADTRRRAEALLTARDAVQHEVERLLQTNEAEFKAETDQHIAAHRGKTMAALAALKAEVDGLHRAKGIRVWLDRPSRGGAAPTPYIPLPSPSGEHYNMVPVLSAMDAWLAGEQEPHVTAYLDDDFAAKHPVKEDD